MRIKCTCSYDGSKYFGWQSQTDVLNIQDTIEKALSIICKEDISICASGRTDRGVHALGQVFHFDSNINMDEVSWVKAINANLPLDIRILETEIVDDNFHARFDVVKKQYDYYLSVGGFDLFNKDYVYQLNQKLNIEKMKECATLFIGEHDFTSFCGNSLEETPNQIRNIETLEISQNGNIVHFKFEGNGFLRYMVRMIVGILIEVGKGKLSKEEVSELLEKKSKEVVRIKADSSGLYLTQVTY